MSEENITTIKTESTKNNIPKKVIIHSDDSFSDVYSKAVVDLINIMLNPV